MHKQMMVSWIVMMVAWQTLLAGAFTEGKTFTNSIGMKMVWIGSGRFAMGAEPGPDVLTRGYQGPDWDESPVHQVTLDRPFHMAATEVTNAQYELFDPNHARFRGTAGLARVDDDAVVFVSWDDAHRFCRWLSEKEKLPYRLPTEAEWEYACRAGTATVFHLGDQLPDGFQKINPTIGPTHFSFWFPDRKKLPGVYRIDESGSLQVAQTPANAWGLYDMHGNVEEWCHDWYGPYREGEQADPTGRAGGEFRVVRGGAHSQLIRLLRSANRSGNIPMARNAVTGFRVVLGEMPATPPLPLPAPPLHCPDVDRARSNQMTRAVPPDEPCFSGPRVFVKIPANSTGPMYSTHNHDPGIAECPNGDLLAIWYSCVLEPGTELSVLASRLRQGAEEWDPASVFYDTPDRNDHGPAIWWDGDRTLCHFNGNYEGLWSSQTGTMTGTILRISTDNGATWSAARQIGAFPQANVATLKTREGHIIASADGPDWTTVIYVSEDGGTTWIDPAEGRTMKEYAQPGGLGPRIAGIHAGIVQLKDGRLMALGRYDHPARQQRFHRRAPLSISSDMGRTWNYSASEFPAISSSQRSALIRLREGPLLYCSFTDMVTKRDAEGRVVGAFKLQEREGLLFRDRMGRQFIGYGLYAALSDDEGGAWPIRKLVTPGGPPRDQGSTDNSIFQLSAVSAEPKGYLALCQATDGMIHLISSKLHYSFNLAWLREMPAVADSQRAGPPLSRTIDELAPPGGLPQDR